jgi:hypothetical protein
VDVSLWEMAKRYRRMAAAIGEDEMTRKAKYIVQLGSARAGIDEASQKAGKGFAAD